MAYRSRTVFLRASAFLLAILVCPLASAYMVENQRGTGYFYGQFCAACWHSQIPWGESRGCPGDSHGCRNKTWIYLFIRKIYYTKNEQVNCYATANVPVTAHGRVVFTTQGILTYDDDGNLIDRSIENYWYDGPFGVLTKIHACVDLKHHPGE